MKRRLNIKKYTSHRVHHLTEKNYLAANLIPRPKWLDAVKMIPPVASTPYTIHPDPFEHNTNIKQLENYCMGLHTHKWLKYKQKPKSILRKEVLEQAKVLKFPRDLIFPEDEWRDRFYKDFPLEKQQPIDVKENFTNDSKDVNGVHGVIKHQQELMEKENLSAKEAYERACSLFKDQREAYYSKLRQEQEEKEKQYIAKQEELKLKSASGSEETEKPLSPSQIWLELEKIKVTEWKESKNKF